MWDAEGVACYRNDQSRALLLLDKFYILLLVHPHGASYRSEVRLIEEVCQEQALARPRELCTGFGFTIMRPMPRLDEGHNGL